MSLTAPADGNPGVLPILKFSAKCGCGRGVPGGLRRSRESGVFPPQLAYAAEGSGIFAGEFSEKGAVGEVKHAAAYVK
jgi:hypothetical protein